MYRYATVVAVLLVGAAVLCEGEAVDAKDADFDAVVGAHPFTLVEFYAPWCGHCKKLAPEWDKAAAALKGEAQLVKVDCTVETETAQKYEINGYPTIKVFRDGQLAGDYDSGRTADAIVKYVKGNSGPAVSAVATADELRQAKEGNEVLVVAFAAEGSAAAQTHEAVAKKLRSRFKFVLASDSALFGSESEGSVVVFKHFDEKREVFGGNDAAALTKFVEDASIRSFDEIGPDNYKSYIDRKLPLGWLFVVPGEAGTDSAKEALSSVAAKYKSSVSLVWVDASKYGSMAERVGLKAGQYPGFAIDFEDAHFVLPSGSAFTSGDFSAFLQDFVDGKLEQTVRSDPVPEEETKDGLTTVVGSRFDELVLKNSKDVFIEFYAPWCGHCKKLAPEYAKLAKQLSGVSTLTIAQLDGTTNDFNKKLFPVSGFPTLYFVPSTTHQPVQYEGDRTAAAILAFIQQKASTPIPASAAGDDEL